MAGPARPLGTGLRRHDGVVWVPDPRIGARYDDY